jgi:hypothetical protein
LRQSFLRREQPAYCRASIVNVNTEEDATATKRIVWYELKIKLGDELFERLREDRKKYEASGAVLDVVLDLFS